MEYQTNIYDAFGIGKTYVDLNQSILNDLLVEVPDEFVVFPTNSSRTILDNRSNPSTEARGRLPPLVSFSPSSCI